MDHSKFKKCQDSGFCVRQRAYSQLRAAPAKLLPETLDFGEAITGRLAANDQLFNFRFTLHPETIHFAVKDHEPLHQRYQQPLLTENLETLGFKYTRESSLVTILFQNDRKLVINYEPFYFTFYVNGVPSVTFNGDGFFYSESHIGNNHVPSWAQPLENIELSDDQQNIESLKKKVVQNLGSEYFDGKTDSKPKGIF